MARPTDFLFLFFLTLLKINLLILCMEIVNFSAWKLIGNLFNMCDVVQQFQLFLVQSGGGTSCTFQKEPEVLKLIKPEFWLASLQDFCFLYIFHWFSSFFFFFEIWIEESEN